MYFTGFADEASKNIRGQIDATKRLGWHNIEARSINGTNITDISEAEFESVIELLEQNGIKINCFGSAIANWSKPPTGNFDDTVEEVKRTIKRMQQAGTKLVRIMSYALLPDKDPDQQMASERFRRLREIKKMFDDAGMTPVHENCMNYGGMSYRHTLELIENVPGLRLVFDTGNPVFLDDRSKPKPYPKQSSWEFYNNVKEHISYIHIKDCTWKKDEKQPVYTYPNEGSGDVYKILTDLLKNGYDGGVSIEPHLAVVFHDGSVKAEEQVMTEKYVEYGKRTEQLIDKIVEELNSGK